MWNDTLVFHLSLKDGTKLPLVPALHILRHQASPVKCRDSIAMGKP